MCDSTEETFRILKEVLLGNEGYRTYDVESVVSLEFYNDTVQWVRTISLLCTRFVLYFTALTWIILHCPHVPPT